MKHWISLEEVSIQFCWYPEYKMKSDGLTSVDAIEMQYYDFYKAEAKLIPVEMLDDGGGCSWDDNELNLDDNVCTKCGQPKYICINPIFKLFSDNKSLTPIFIKAFAQSSKDTYNHNYNKKYFAINKSKSSAVLRDDAIFKSTNLEVLKNQPIEENLTANIEQSELKEKFRPYCLIVLKRVLICLTI